jgi:hexosaminidase
LRERLQLYTHSIWHIRAGTEAATIRLTVDPELSRQEEAYHLSIKSHEISIVGGGTAGVFYGCQTLSQLLRQYGAQLPCLFIEDAPDFPVRGYLLDISRDRVPTMQTLLALVDRLAEWKINHLQLYMEHTFAYVEHEAVWRDASPLTGEKILELDSYCRSRAIDLVPNQASFAHMERWLKHPSYASLSESMNGWLLRNKQSVSYPFTLNPLHPGSFDLIAQLYQDLLPHFSSPFVNENCDEPFELGQGASREAVAQWGKPDVYFEFVGKLNTLVRSTGHRMLYWADFYWEHPEAVKLHPTGAIALEWGYAAEHDFFTHATRLAEADIPFYVCPGTSAWNSFIGRTDNALANIVNAAEAGLRHGASGFLNTDWGDNGSLSYLPVSYLGIAWGTANGWSSEQARQLPFIEALSLHAFGDPSGEIGRFVHTLGNAYRLVPAPLKTSAAPHRLLIKDALAGWYPLEPDAQALRDALEYVSDLAARWNPLRSPAEDSTRKSLIYDEFRNNIAMWQHGCRYGLARIEEARIGKPDWGALVEELQSIITEHHRLWLARNRLGGLVDSARRLASRLPEYFQKLDS